jgi:cyclohexanone monooxygenase
MSDVNLEDIEIDVDALERKYAEERDKRLRSDSVSQFQELKGKFAGFDHDPYADKSTRPAIVADADVVVIGGGFSGLLAGARLREKGVKSLRIIDKGGDFGGTWYWNRYPGAACDVESYIYMPLLEETGYVPTEKYAKAPEIFAYCRRLGRHYDLYREALLQTDVRSANWDATRRRWLVRTDRDDVIAARFVISCTGFLNKPKLPGIPGIETFAGHAFHTSRWDYEYTGGAADGKLTGLQDKRVGVIGTGSTGIQCIPRTAEWSGQMFVFQRTPSSIDPRGNRPTDLDWAKTLQPGWQRTRTENFTSLTSGRHQAVDLVNDSWTDILRHVAPPAGGDGAAVDPKQLQLAEMKKMEQARRRIASIVKNPAVAEALKPWYHYFCKRPCFHDEYLETFNRPNVTLVDTKGKGVERITPAGVVVAGREYPLDCLIFATGFDFLTEYARESGVAIVGPGNQPLSDHWQTGPRTLHGMMTHGFPNFFVTGLAQAGVAINFMHMADEQSRHLAHIIGWCLEERVDSVQPTQQAEQEWVQQIVANSGPRRAFLAACTPGYYNYEGKQQRFAELLDFYAAGPMAYVGVLENWRKQGMTQDLEITRSGQEPSAGEERTVKVTFIEPDGTPKIVHARVGASLMNAATRAGVRGILAECGGSCTCATCHVYVEPEWGAMAGPAGPVEQEMLTIAVEPRPNSRLSCQIQVTEKLEGLVVRVPQSQF